MLGRIGSSSPAAVSIAYYLVACGLRLFNPGLVWRARGRKVAPVLRVHHSHRVQDCLVIESASVSYGKATAYLPAIELLRNYFRIEGRRQSVSSSGTLSQEMMAFSAL